MHLLQSFQPLSHLLKSLGEISKFILIANLWQMIELPVRYLPGGKFQLMDGARNIPGNGQRNENSQEEAADAQPSSYPKGGMADAQCLQAPFVLVFPCIMSDCLYQLKDLFLLLSDLPIAVPKSRRRKIFPPLYPCLVETIILLVEGGESIEWKTGDIRKN